jgi:hypothetical protein
MGEGLMTSAEIRDTLVHGAAAPKVPDRVFIPADWNKLLDDTFEKVRGLGRDKGGEYSGDQDRLLNFRRNARDNGLTMEQIWRIYASKHWDAIGQYIRDMAEGRERTRTEPLSGRVDDLIVYALLFKAMLIERGEA